jgi:23S rRNA (pseudouridine1915-N3)-methyltransferase
MKLHIITVGVPKLTYAKQGWEEYLGRLKHYHQICTTHIADKHNDAAHLLEAAGSAYKVAMVINGKQFDSPGLAQFLDNRSQMGREVCIIIGGPDGLPHDLAMVVTLEALYRASTISAGLPYHK